MITETEKISNLAGDGYLVLHRINYNGQRIYINPNPFKHYSGLTGALSAATFSNDPAKKRLKSWRESMIDSYGKQNANNYVDATADFGTLLHESLVTIKNDGKIDWAIERDKSEVYFHEMFITKGINDKALVRKTSYEYLKHVASMMQFIHERVSEIYAIETPAVWDELNIATPIDLVADCRPTPKADHLKSVINIKTSKQITSHHLEQVACELFMWDNTYRDGCVSAGIMRTKDWREDKTPTYEYKAVSEPLNLAAAAANRLKLCLNTDASYYPNPTSKYFKGETFVGQTPEIEIKSLEQEWNEL